MNIDDNEIIMIAVYLGYEDTKAQGACREI